MFVDDDDGICLCSFLKACSPKSVTKPSNHHVSGIVAATGTATGSPSPNKPPKPAAVNKMRQENKYPQTIAVVKGKKYVMVAKPLSLPPNE